MTSQVFCDNLYGSCDNKSYILNGPYNKNSLSMFMQESLTKTLLFWHVLLSVTFHLNTV